MAHRWERRKNKKRFSLLSREFVDFRDFLYICNKKKINIMAMFLGSLVVIGVFVVIEIIGNAIKNMEDSKNEKGN